MRTDRIAAVVSAGMALKTSEEGWCICETCPSYPTCAADKGIRMFCFRGKAECDVLRHGCICPSCKVYKKHHFTLEYFCAEGTNEERS